ncbi:hypothetical protein EAF00_004020 [Botryotinia globosa]|nr:hypothetical protein EAF00_004020 [Botryotinia globosa]
MRRAIPTHVHGSVVQNHKLRRCLGLAGPRCSLGPVGRDVVVGAESGLPFDGGLVETGPGLPFAEDGELAVGYEAAGGILLVGEGEGMVAFARGQFEIKLASDCGCDILSISSGSTGVVVVAEVFSKIVHASVVLPALYLRRIGKWSIGVKFFFWDGTKVSTIDTIVIPNNIVTGSIKGKSMSPASQ